MVENNNLTMMLCNTHLQHPLLIRSDICELFIGSLLLAKNAMDGRSASVSESVANHAFHSHISSFESARMHVVLWRSSLAMSSVVFDLESGHFRSRWERRQKMFLGDFNGNVEFSNTDRRPDGRISTLEGLVELLVTFEAVRSNWTNIRLISFRVFWHS